MNEYDHRQLSAMREQLNAYGEGRVDLGAFIASLEALQNALHTMPESWRDEFREQWGVLEQVYSVAIDRDEPIESVRNAGLIAPALARMREMLSNVPDET